MSLGWERWVGDEGAIVGLDHFGASAPAGTIFEHLGFTAARVADVGRRVVREGLRGRIGTVDGGHFAHMAGGPHPTLSPGDQASTAQVERPGTSLSEEGFRQPHPASSGRCRSASRRLAGPEALAVWVVERLAADHARERSPPISTHQSSPSSGPWTHASATEPPSVGAIDALVTWPTRSVPRSTDSPCHSTADGAWSEASRRGRSSSATRRAIERLPPDVIGCFATRDGEAEAGRERVVERAHVVTP